MESALITLPLFSNIEDIAREAASMDIEEDVLDSKLHTHNSIVVVHACTVDIYFLDPCDSIAKRTGEPALC